MIATIRRPASKNNSLRPACVATNEPFPGKDKPKASVKQFMELAVNIPEQEPQVGQAFCSTSVIWLSEMLSSAASTIASTKSKRRSSAILIEPMTLPASIGPPDTKMVGIFKRIAAISLPCIRPNRQSNHDWVVSTTFQSVPSQYHHQQRLC